MEMTKTAIETSPRPLRQNESPHEMKPRYSRTLAVFATIVTHRGVHGGD